MCEINENGGLMNGIKVEFMITFSTTGSATLLYLVTSSLSENELIMTNKEL